MKHQVLALTTLLVLTGSASAATGTATFSVDGLECDVANGRIRFAGFDAAGVGQAMTLPSRTYYLALEPGDSAEAISYQVTEWEQLGQVGAGFLSSDIPTGQVEGVLQTADLSLYPDLGRRAVEVIDELEIDQSRYLRLMLFPVTLQEDGSTRFNKSIPLFLNGEPISSERLLPEPPGATHRAWQDAPGMSSGGAGPIEYIIITARELAAPMLHLAAYKNSTGYLTAVEYIDDILSSRTGRDDAEKLRNHLVQFHLEGGRFVLLAGDHTVLPIRYAYHQAVDSMPELGLLQVCDLYFADLTGEWDQDNDNVWGERTDDRADLIPELWVGRLPFNTAEQFDAYLDKLIAYEIEPGGDDPGYLSRTFFFSSDQMRDYSGGGQHARIAEAYPEHFVVDTANGVELDRGDDPAPHNVAALELEAVLSDGYGIVNVIAHGSRTLFEVRTSEYNTFPKSRFTTDTTPSNNGVVSHLAPNKKVSLYYSLACDNGGFDLDYSAAPPNLVVSTLGLPKAGAVGFVANSRWGWVGSSHLLQKAFFDSLFAHPDRPAVAAMYDAKLRYHYVRDVVYGQNFYGDPTLIVYGDVPANLTLEVYAGSGVWEMEAASAGSPVSGCLVVLSDSTGVLDRVFTDDMGRATIRADFDPLNSYTVAAVKAGYVIERQYYVPSIAADAEDRIDDALPTDFHVSQNYPNPFNPYSTIRFELPRRSRVDLSVYNILGRHVATLSAGMRPFGAYEVTWDGCDRQGAAVASGVYFYRLIADGFSEEKKMVLLR